MKPDMRNMIISKQAYVKIAPNNVTFWKSLGYDVKPLGCGFLDLNKQRLKIKIEHLKPNSNVTVACRCEKCLKKYLNRYGRALNNKFCSSCSVSNRMKNNNYGGKTRTYEIPDKIILENLHFTDNKSIEDIRKIYNVSRPVVVGWFKHHGIKAKNFLTRQDIPSKDELIKLHHHDKIPIKTLAKKFSTGSNMIKTWMNGYGIEILKHRMKRTGERPSKEELIQLNKNDKKNFEDMASIYGVSSTLIRVWFKDYDIDPVFHISTYGKEERNIRDELNLLGFNFIKTRSVLENNRELDCYDSSLKLAIEYCGLYWHRDEVLGKQYHINKLNECEKLGIKLITIFEDEWLEKKDIVISIIKNKLGISERIQARKCKLQVLDKSQTRDFCIENHLQGSPHNIEKSYGLFFDDELIGLMCFGKHHRNENEEMIILNRLCFKKNISIVGGTERLFNMAKNEFSKSILTWSDRRWSSGNIYKKLGFEKITTYGPDYSYFKAQKRYSKQSMKKSKVGCPKHIKEIYFNKDMGFGVIWDCGKDVWMYKP